MHLDDEQLQRMLHGELRDAARSLNEHASTCVDCRSRLAEAGQEERWVFDRLLVLDHAQPPVSLERILVSASAQAPVWHRWAAGIALLLTAAGVAYAAPGSPLTRVFQQVMTMLGQREHPAVVPAVSAPANDLQAGIAVDPGSRLTIVFRGAQPGGVAIVSLGDSSEIIVRATGGSTTFTSDVDRVTIDHGGPPATTNILIPRLAPRVEIYAGGTRIFLKRNSTIVSPAHPDREGRYQLLLSGMP